MIGGKSNKPFEPDIPPFKLNPGVVLRGKDGFFWMTNGQKWEKPPGMKQWQLREIFVKQKEEKTESLIKSSKTSKTKEKSQDKIDKIDKIDYSNSQFQSKKTKKPKRQRKSRKSKKTRKTQKTRKTRKKRHSKKKNNLKDEVQVKVHGQNEPIVKNAETNKMKEFIKKVKSANESKHQHNDKIKKNLIKKMKTINNKTVKEKKTEEGNDIYTFLDFRFDIRDE